MKFTENTVWSIYETTSDVKESIFNVFKEFYGLNKLNVYFKGNDNPLLIEKFNVIGMTSYNDCFTLYETSSLNKIIQKFDFNDIEKIVKI